MATQRIVLTDQKLRAAKPAPKGTRYFLYDAVLPGLDVQITDTGRKSFGMKKRWPLKPKNPTRRALGDCYLPPKGEGEPPELGAENGALTLAEARNKGRRWLDLLSRGIDPDIEEARQRAAELRKQVNTFAEVWDAFEKQHAAKLAKAGEAKRAGVAFKREWHNRLAAEILPEEISAHIRKIAAKTPPEARNRFGHLNRMYSWAIGTGGFGITDNPAAKLKPSDMVGAKVARERILTDDELRRVWAACNGPVGAEALKEARRRDRKPDPNAPLGFPYGPLFQLMILTGQRESEVAGMRWSEIDLGKQLWTIPAARMKSDRVHAVPLAPLALALIKSLPRFSGDCAFTTTGGDVHVSGFSKAKKRLDQVSGVTGWVLHDLRRSMRTHLSALPVQDMVREIVIAHARPGLHRVYDQHAYLDEKRQCLELWEQRLAGILSPKPPADVADLGAERERRAVQA